MNADDYGTGLRAAFGRLSWPVPPGTPLARAGGDVREMAAAYLDDGDTFLARGDPVNALACYTYAAGWLRAAGALGLCGGELPGEVPGLIATVPPGRGPFLEEKAGRYERMLRDAAASVSPAPDPASPLYPAAVQAVAEASRHLAEGTRLRGTGDPWNALARFSHGHGWLDAAVRAGLLVIRGPRSLFAI